MANQGEKDGSIPYAIAHASYMDKEVKRLDEMHNGYKEYLDGKLSLAPLEELKPTAILELGTGSGLWAIQAAMDFPDAEVTAVDLRPLPASREIPPNMHVRLLNVLEPLPFPECHFDIIHARLFFMHIPEAAQVIKRITKHLKPGGWLLLEDLDFELFDLSELGLGSATKEWTDLYNNTMKVRGVEDVIQVYPDALKASGDYSEVNIKRITFDISGKGDDFKSQKLGLAFRWSLTRVSEVMADQDIPDFTHELAAKYKEELWDPRRNIISYVVFTWAKKQL
ncbi:hypothetical protein M422DRAFT_777679 [Sphaerobolus stellatus SS14]|nr:hypothetical protein M422DRAFT_777679 [Sphaerobolus stellatus SS14]